MTDRPELAGRWAASLTQAAEMADAPAVKPGTRYDALRMVALADWRVAEPALAKYLAKTAHPELQMGAVSGFADTDRPEVGPRLAKALPDLTPKNRALAVAGMMRTTDRVVALVEAADPTWLTTEQKEALLKHPDAAVREKAAKRFGP